ncbi:sigma-70 family RNA polymerase sigma factor [Aquisphaera insulae]|uniref:sigma-70 family RNA polymerase sigma factor n=1 Tax=Aquisphaera insulae TaxID=2712864 RepID=UPI0013EAEA28|nr:sigma-70 family RNA polymerase sigma factor [Aquisphaera insulae]
MTAATIADVHGHLQALFDHGVLGSLSDARLLERFLDAPNEEAEAAFGALVERHAAMVLRVCRATLGHRQDAEDAAQAVFLVLARRARSVRRSESAASWLHGVARRTALRARRDAVRRTRHEWRRAETMARDHEATASPLDESWEELHREIDRLPDAYRAAIVLRHLEGLSHDECASRLGCPLRTFQSRLLRARDRLRDQLKRRGISLAVVLPDVPAARPVASEPSVAWVEATARAARGFASGTGAAGASSTAIALARSVAGRMMIVAPIPMTFVIAATVCAAAVAAPLARRHMEPSQLADHPAPEPRLLEAGNLVENTDRTIEIRVVEKAGGGPVEGAEVLLNVPGTGFRPPVGSMKVAARQMTDAKGLCRVKIPEKKPRWFRIDVRKPGYAERSYANQQNPGSILPASHTIELERGTSIGGVVRRRDGTPIAGARIIIVARTLSRRPADREDYTLISEENAKVVTDAQGRWRFDEMPSTWASAYIRFAHSDFVPPSLTEKTSPPSDEDLRATRAETILDEGFAVEGRVVDDAGRPIAGASVLLGDGPRRSKMDLESPSTASDAEGRFRFGHVPTGTQTIEARAGGKSPSQVSINVEPGMTRVEIRLSPGHKVIGRVVDPRGKPIEGVTINATDSTGHIPLGWSGTSDADGRFTWDSAPAGPVYLDLAREGYIRHVRRECQPNGPEITLTMYPPLRIRGRVTDAKTDRPIPRFRIIEGDHYRESGPEVDRIRYAIWDDDDLGRSFSDGEYEVEIARIGVLAASLRIEAMGHRTITSPPIRLEAGTATFDAAMESASDVVGFIHGPEGRPVPDAEVILRPREGAAQFQDGVLQPRSLPRITTDAQGLFRFPPQTAPHCIFATHDEGFADVDGKALDGSKPITLTPWGRVEGVVKLGPRPAVGVAVTLSEVRPPSSAVGEAWPITQNQVTMTDRDGRYAFERALPGNLMVARMFTPDRPASRATKGAWRRIKVESGKTVRVDLGGKGRAVVGRFVLPAGVKPGAVFPYLGQSLQRVGAGIPYPPGLDEARREEWVRTWLETEEGRAYDDSQVAVDTNVRPDGSFRVDDVLPGRYRMRAAAHEPGTRDGEVGPLVAEADVQVIVPGASGGDPNQPLDLGAIEMKRFRPGP